MICWIKSNENLRNHHQRNAAERTIFASNSINTLTTFALTHELESYKGRAALTKFIELIHGQLAPGGRLLNVDVVGPENKDEIINLRLNRDDGSNDASLGELRGFSRDDCRAALERMSTYARFRRFQKDFRHAEGYQLAAETEVIDGTEYLRLRLQDACEFLSKKKITLITGKAKCTRRSATGRLPIGAGHSSKRGSRSIRRRMLSAIRGLSRIVIETRSSCFANLATV